MNVNVEMSLLTNTADYPRRAHLPARPHCTALPAAPRRTGLSQPADGAGQARVQWLAPPRGGDREREKRRCFYSR